MVNIEDRFFSFKNTELAGFDRITELAQQYSVIPPGFDCDHFKCKDEEISSLRESLDRAPDKRELLQAEHDAHLKKLRASARQAAAKFIPTPPGASQAHNTGGQYEIKQGHVSFTREAVRLSALLEATIDYFGPSCRVQGDFYYPEGGFRTWHTNRLDTPGWRMYLVNADTAGRSFFRLQVSSSGELYTQWDHTAGVNFFLIDPQYLIWHCIGAETNRWSKGFLVPPDWRDRLRYR